jgi:transcriptional regulator with XRE-family HTH domain
MNLGQRIALLRAERGWSAQQLADLANEAEASRCVIAVAASSAAISTSCTQRDLDLPPDPAP